MSGMAVAGCSAGFGFFLSLSLFPFFFLAFD